MDRRGSSSRNKRRRGDIRLARLAISALAALGLLGHGLAMLLVAALAQTPTGGAAEAADGFPAWVEICTADGATRFVATGGGQAPAPLPAHDPGHLKLCPVCTAFAQAGVADLPVALMPLVGTADATAWQPPADAPASGRSVLSALSRGPPAAA